MLLQPIDDSDIFFLLNSALYRNITSWYFFDN